MPSLDAARHRYAMLPRYFAMHAAYDAAAMHAMPYALIFHVTLLFAAMPCCVTCAATLADATP